VELEDFYKGHPIGGIAEVLSSEELRLAEMRHVSQLEHAVTQAYLFNLKRIELEKEHALIHFLETHSRWRSVLSRPESSALEQDVSRSSSQFDRVRKMYNVVWLQVRKQQHCFNSTKKNFFFKFNFSFADVGQPATSVRGASDANWVCPRQLVRR